MAQLSWRSLVLSTLAATSFLTGSAQTSDACCLFGGWGDCCGGGYGGFYRGYSGYYSGYAPSYGYYAPAYGYGPAYAYAPSYGYGNAVASAGYGCSSCVGGGCGISEPVTNPTRPVPDRGPDDGYRGTPGSRLNDTPSVDAPRRSKLKSETNSPDNTLPKSTRPGASSFDQGFGRGAAGTKDADPGAVEEEPFRTPRTRSDGSRGTDIDDKFDVDANKPPMPKAAEEQPEEDKETEKPTPPIDNDSFDSDGDEASTGVEVKRPDLGSASDADENPPADAEAATGEPNPQGAVIKPREPAPLDIPEPEEAVPEPQLPDDLKELDEKPTSAGVSPKVRLVLRGRFGTPSIVRLKLRPNHDWQPTSHAPVLAKH